MDNARLRELIEAHLDESLSDDDRIELEAALRSSAAARELFWELSRWNLWIELAVRGSDTASAEPAEDVAEQDDAARQGELSLLRRATQRYWTPLRDFANQPATLAITLSMLSLTIILLSLALWRLPAIDRSPVADQTPLAEVAAITQTHTATWAAASAGQQRNRRLFTGDQLELTSGLAEVTFDNGTIVLLQGPAQLQVESLMRISLQHGKLTALVSQEAVGFTVDAPGVQVIDLGTEFGMSVDPQAGGQLAVFDGAVTAHVGQPSAGRDFHLAAGESLAWLAGGGSAVKSQLSDGPKFARQMPQRIKFTLVATGVEVDEQGLDQQWRILGPDDQSERARVIQPVSSYAAWEGESRWISISSADWLRADPDRIYRFAVEFDLPRVDPATVYAQGRVAVDNRVVAVWLNGERLPYSQTDAENFRQVETFPIAGPFQATGNRLEFEVANTFTQPNPMAFRLEATAVGTATTPQD